jgi:hypothetical protein
MANSGSSPWMMWKFTCIIMTVVTDVTMWELKIESFKVVSDKDHFTLFDCYDGCFLPWPEKEVQLSVCYHISKYH